MSVYLQINELTKCYHTNFALKGVSFCVEKGQVLALLGPNGAGKSTLFGCLLGFTLPTSGNILLNDRPLTQVDRRTFGYAAERTVFYSHRTVRENAVFLAELNGISSHEAERQVERLGLAGVRDRKVRQLSKGMLQRLGLAIALCGAPQLLVLDEPFNGLDPALLEILQGILNEERRRGCTLLISTHTMSAVERLATHVGILLEGRLAVLGTLGSLRAEYGGTDSLESIYHQIAIRGRNVEEVLI